MSRNKGKRAEREVIALISPIIERLYIKAGQEPPLLQRNTLQSDQGGFDICGLEWLALEVKHCETFQLASWWEQTLSQAKRGAIPVLFYRRNNVSFRVRMPGGIGRSDLGWLPVLPVDVSTEDFARWLEKALQTRLGL